MSVQASSLAQSRLVHPPHAYPSLQEGPSPRLAGWERRCGGSSPRGSRASIQVCEQRLQRALVDGRTDAAAAREQGQSWTHAARRLAPLPHKGHPRPSALDTVAASWSLLGCPTMRDRARLLLPPLLLLLLSCCALPTRGKELATPEILLDTVHNLKVFKPRAKHCIKNVISYRDAPPDRRGRFHVLLGRMVEYVDQITEKNYKAKIRQLARSGGTLNKAFGQAFSKCLQDPCSQPPEPGWCLQNMVMFYYDVDSRSCHEFTYTGCGRNFNNFLTKEECQSICTRGRS
ncbi:uncharacterized protein LOC144159709 isoform X2 [Haemaphysalis longicornis]